MQLSFYYYKTDVLQLPNGVRDWASELLLLQLMSYFNAIGYSRSFVLTRKNLDLTGRMAKKRYDHTGYCLRLDKMLTILPPTVHYQ